MMSPTRTLEVDLEPFATAHRAGAFVLEPAEYASGHVPRALLVPLGSLAERVRELPEGRTIHVICASGNRSLTAARALAAAGYDAVSVAGGTSAWIRSGRRVAIGMGQA
jgi:rhodanese-related sulfurtransferase